MSEAIITPLRPKAKDPTGAQRQARFRKKRKGVVTAAKSAVAADAPSPAPVAPSPACGEGDRHAGGGSA